MFNPKMHFPSKSGTIFLAWLTAATLALMAPASVCAAGSNKAVGKQLISSIAPPLQMMIERTVDARDFIQDMADAAAAMKSYQFEYSTLVFKGDKQLRQDGQFYFKSPRLIRVQMTGSYKHGAVAVLGRDGKVRGHLGGALAAFTVTVAATSDMLLGANGYPLTDSDFASMAGVIKKFLQQGCKSKVTEHPVAVEGQGKKVYVLEIYRGADGSELYKRAYIDPQTLLPLEWFDYQDGRLFARTIWKNLKTDAALNDELFKI